MTLNSIQEIIEDIRCGKMVVLMDDEDRENEGDLIMAASHVRAEDINFMAKHARGLICLTMTEERCQRLNLPLMVRNNQAAHGTAFTLSIEAREGVTTGISAADRAQTIRVATAHDARAQDIVQPGHVFPLMAQPGGVLFRAGHTEAGCDLARLAGFEPAAVIVEIMNEDGTMARRPDLEVFAEQHGLKIGTIADLIQYRMSNEKTVVRFFEHDIETAYGPFRAIGYKDQIDGGSHLALVKGQLDQQDAPLVRVHVSDSLRDLIKTHHPEQGWDFGSVMQRIASESSGAIVLIGQREDEKNSLAQRMHNYCTGHANLPHNNGVRTIGTGSQILRDLGIQKMRLLSSPMRYSALSGFDLEIVEFIPFQRRPSTL